MRGLEGIANGTKVPARKVHSILKKTLDSRARVFIIYIRREWREYSRKLEWARVHNQTEVLSMMMLKTRVSRLIFYGLLLGAVAAAPAVAASTAIGSVAGSMNARLSGQALRANTTIFSGDSLEVSDGVAVVAIGTSNRVIFGRDTVASFVRDASQVTVVLSQGDISMLHPSEGTPLRVKAGEVSITPVANLKTLGDIALLDSTLVITTKEGALQVEEHGVTKNVARGQTLVIGPKSPKSGAGAASGVLGGATAASVAGASSAGSAAASAADAATAAGKFIRPGPTRPLIGSTATAAASGPGAASSAAAAAAAAGASSICAPPTVPRIPTASGILPFAGSSGPICPFIVQ